MDLATVCQHFILHMECVSSMYLRKTCPKCDTVVHVKLPVVAAINLH